MIQKLEILLWHSRLRIWHGHCSSLGYCCGAGSVPGPGTSAFQGHGWKKKNDSEIKNPKLGPPSLGISICHECGPKKAKKKKKKKEKKIYSVLPIININANYSYIKTYQVGKNPELDNLLCWHDCGDGSILIHGQKNDKTSMERNLARFSKITFASTFWHSNLMIPRKHLQKIFLNYTPGY